MTPKENRRQETFVDNGEPVAVMGAATKNMRQENNALVIPPDENWGNPLFADLPLEENDFHIHARLTLDSLTGTGASFLIGGYYHYPCSRPEGNRTFRVSLDDAMETYDPYKMETDARILYGITERRAPWREASKEIAGVTADYIEPGKAFDLDVVQEGQYISFRIDGKEVFSTSLQQNYNIQGGGDGGWPVCFGFLPDQAQIKLHDFYAEGTFTESCLEHKDVWTLGHAHFFTYRIPSICVTPSDSLLVFAEARRSDFSKAWGWEKKWNPDEVHCVMKRSTDGGQTWSEQKTILERGARYEARDPAPVVDYETGEIILMLRGPYVMKSNDDGESWSEPQSVREQLGKTGSTVSPGPANSGIQLGRNETHKGRLVFAVGIIEEERKMGLLYSDDHGDNWTLGGTIEGYRGVEPQVEELRDGRVLINARQHSENAGRLIAISHDGGNTLEEVYYDSQLPSKNCQASLHYYNSTAATTVSENAPILFCGPDASGGRRNLTVKASYDDCESWPVARLIYAGHSAYSTLTTLPNGEVGVLYERDGYRRLSFVRFSPEWVKSG